MPEVYDAAARIGTFATKWRDANVYSVGTGLYGLVAVYEDGGRSLAIIGFDSASDAALFAPYAHKTVGTARPRRVMQTPFGQVDADPDVPHSQRLRYEVIMISTALPSEAFDQLLPGGPR